MDNLNNTQIVLLTLMVSFVTSIATGIVTVTLIEQAPTGVTQTINRVVEKTVEVVIPEGFKETVIEERVVVNQEDVVVAAIEGVKDAFVAIAVAPLEDDVENSNREVAPTSNETKTDEGKPAENPIVPIAHGVIVDSKGHILTLFPAEADVTYLVSTDEIEKRARLVRSDEATGLALLKIDKPDGLVHVNPSDARVSLGQTAIRLNQSRVNIGFVATVLRDAKDEKVVEVKTNLATVPDEDLTVLVNTERELIGLYANGEYVSVSDIVRILSPPETSELSEKTPAETAQVENAAPTSGDAS